MASYGYDASNRRIIKTVGSTVTHYIYDASSNLIAETDADGTVSKEYIYLDGTVIAIKDYGTNAGLYYAITDNIGTPQQLITASGTVVWQASYLPFGEAQVTTSTVTNNIRFPGQYFDKETGLHYNWHRFYNPSTGRYVSADLIGLRGGMNLYAYVEGNPVNNSDANGLLVTGIQCLIYVKKAQESCGKSFDVARDSYIKQMQNCKDEGLECVIDQQDYSRCDEFESCKCNSYKRYICIGEICNSNIDEWMKLIGDTLTEDCRDSISNIPLKCIPMPDKFPVPDLPNSSRW